MTTIKNKYDQGPWSYNNWMAARDGLAPLATYEYPFFTDAHIFGEITEGFGPYKLLFNSVPELQRSIPFPAVILRLEYHLPGIAPSNESISLSKKAVEAQMSRYHGGTLTEEIAALVSLCLGVRMKSGGMVREFLPGEDPRGRPRGFEGRYDPILAVGGQISSPILPDALRSHALVDADLIHSLPDLSAENAVALVSAARLFQDALWIAEAQPELSWLMLVSALETGANAWKRQEGNATERMASSKPELHALLRERCKADVVNKVADMIADSLGSTKKFVGFVDAFFPDPPKIRPKGVFMFSWTKTNMEKAMKRIYGLRSSALHDGTPFPRPMCTPPFSHNLIKYEKVVNSAGETKRKQRKIRAYDEVPLGLATSSLGITWPIDYTPMLLRTFTYITHNVLINWWSSLLLP